MGHIQDEHNAKSLEPHWGYSSRVVPCVVDKGSCEYLSAVYWMHDVSMLYAFIFWAVVGCILAIWLALRLLGPRLRTTKSKQEMESGALQKQPFFRRLYNSCATFRRHWLLPETLPSIFGHVSRLQVTVLAVLLGYLLIFSFVGVVYKTWVTPIKGTTLHNTRTGIGPWGDRVGALAYALTPFTVALSTRESILSLITGVPYQHFNFLHRWTGRVIYIQSVLHTIAWTVVEAKLYQPQPKVYRGFIQQQYMVFGCVALLFISFLYIFSLRSVIKLTGYEFFRKSHYIVALLYIAACWGHWTRLACWMIASFGLFGIDRAMRLVRTFLIHTGRKNGHKGIGFRSAQSKVTVFPDPEAAVVRVDFDFEHSSWQVGQHYFLCFPALSVWQSHPMTPASLPHSGTIQHHTYIIKARKGQTKQLAELASTSIDTKDFTTPVILTGAYGNGVLGSASELVNVMAVAGGTGISFALPVVMAALRRAENLGAGAVELVWVIRKTQNVEWILPELAELRKVVRHRKVDFRVRLFITRDTRPANASSIRSEESSPDPEKLPITTQVTSQHESSILETVGELDGFSTEWLSDHHPHFDSAEGLGIIESWLDRSALGGRNMVFGSGVSKMGTDLRLAVAAENRAFRVWKGQGRYDVEFLWDERG